MAGSTPKIHQRTVGGVTYIAETSRHEQGISVVVTLPGKAPTEQNDRTFATEQEALLAADAIARSLMEAPGRPVRVRR